MKTSMLKWLSYSLVVLLFCACVKEKIARMEKGKYLMTIYWDFENGNKDTVSATLFGPYISKEYFFFSPDPESIMKTDALRIYVGKKHKKYEHFEIYVYFDNSMYPTNVGGVISTYKIDKTNFNIKFWAQYVKGEMQLKKIGT